MLPVVIGPPSAPVAPGPLPAPAKAGKPPVAVRSLPRTRVVTPLHEHHCRNCGAEADDLFCPHCGQETRIALPTAPQFMREAAGRFVALDSRLWRTLALLLTRPGFLTNAYLGGRRMRYVRPARLFLFTSIIAFALVRFVGGADLIGLGDKGADGIASNVEEIRAAERAKDAAKLATEEDAAARAALAPAKGAVEVDGEDSTLLNSDALQISFDHDANLILGGSSAIVKPMRERIANFNHLPSDEKRRQLAASAFRYGPYAAFALLPAFAFLLQILYALPSRRFPQRPRRFAAHLVFGAHNHAFLFVVISLIAVLPHFSGRDVTVAAFACLYLLLSLRRVYGGSWIGILTRALVIAIAYSVMFGVAVALLLAVAVLLR